MRRKTRTTAPPQPSSEPLSPESQEPRESATETQTPRGARDLTLVDSRKEKKFPGRETNVSDREIHFPGPEDRVEKEGDRSGEKPGDIPSPDGT